MRIYIIGNDGITLCGEGDWSGAKRLVFIEKWGPVPKRLGPKAPHPKGV